MLTILDEHTRECHVLRADRALRSKDVLEWLGKAIKEHGAPQYLRSDNGSEFIAKEVQRWLAQNQFTSSRPVRGRTGSWRASMAGSGTSA
jgi:putative transposase